MSVQDYEPIVTVPTIHAYGALALYKAPYGSTVHLDLGNTIVTTSDTDLVPLAKAILNAMEPEALVENQKATEPEPYKPGDWVKVTDSAAYNDNFRDQTLQVADPAYPVYTDGLRLIGKDGDIGIIDADKVTPASAPTPARDLAAELDALKAYVVALDPEIRVGDTVRVEPHEWNIGGTWCDNETLEGEVTWVKPENQTWGSRFLVRVTPSRGREAGVEQYIYARTATKVAPRG